MIHARQSVRRGSTAQVAPSRGSRRWLVSGLSVLAALALSLGALACGDGGTQPDALRYGQLGAIHILLKAPLYQGVGGLRQALDWESSGAWTITEAISYDGVEGDENVRKNVGDPGQFAASYAALITQLNEVDGLKLFIPELPPELIPECGPTRTEITFTIRDDARKEHTTWIRCADGSLGTLTPENAGPDPAASRIALATILARDYTVGEGFASVYAGSVPFATLDRGEDLASSDRTSVVFTDSAAFRSFWRQAGGGKPLPTVDFSREMVILGAVGVREEAGDSVEVRKILPVDQGTLIEVWERVPGDFCSPASRTHVPYHVVVSPLTPEPLRFSDVRIERVPCGG